MTNPNQPRTGNQTDTDTRTTARTVRRTAIAALGLSTTLLLSACETGGNAIAVPPSSADASPSTAFLPANGETTTVAPTTDPRAQFIGKAVLLPGSVHTEVKQYTKPDKPSVFTDYRSLTAAPQSIPFYQPDTNGVSASDQLAASYNVDCYVYDPTQADNTTRGVFYHVTGWAEGNPNVSQGSITGDFTVANTNWNQPQIGEPDLQHRFDPAVPPCPGSPVAPNTGN